MCLLVCFLYAMQNLFSPIPYQQQEITHSTIPRNTLIIYQHTLSFSYTKYSFIKNTTIQKSFECICKKNLLQVIQKILLLRVIYYSVYLFI